MLQKNIIVFMSRDCVGNWDLGWDMKKEVRKKTMKDEHK